MGNLAEREQERAGRARGRRLGSRRGACVKCPGAEGLRENGRLRPRSKRLAFGIFCGEHIAFVGLDLGKKLSKEGSALREVGKEKEGLKIKCR